MPAVHEDNDAHSPQNFSTGDYQDVQFLTVLQVDHHSAFNWHLLCTPEGSLPTMDCWSPVTHGPGGFPKERSVCPSPL